MDNRLTAPLAPKIYRFADIDEFRSSVRHLNVEFTPLVRKISAEQIILNLPGCDVNYTKSFPRIIDAQLCPNCTAVAFTMDDGVPLRFNGVEDLLPAITIGSGGSLYTQVEKAPRSYTSIIFSPGVEDRGWPEAGPTWRFYVVSKLVQDRLRRLVLQVLAAATEFGDDLDSGVLARAMRESLFAAVDMAIADVALAPEYMRANFSSKFKIFRDADEALAEHYDGPIYSGELAQQIGVSVRTLHDTILYYRGMSLHRYLRLRRLWLVRQRLVAGTHSVKAAALAFGFWHMGDFSRSYVLQFGETPSATLAISRPVRGPRTPS
jgi:AraC family ethanolamine operon transcriptional activator